MGQLGVGLGLNMCALPADSLPMTNVTGEVCGIDVLRALLAEERKERSDARGRGMLMSRDGLQVPAVQDVLSRLRIALLPMVILYRLSISEVTVPLGISKCKILWSWEIIILRDLVGKAFFAQGNNLFILFVDGGTGA